MWFGVNLEAATRQSMLQIVAGTRTWEQAELGQTLIDFPLTLTANDDPCRNRRRVSLPNRRNRPHWRDRLLLSDRKHPRTGRNAATGRFVLLLSSESRAVAVLEPFRNPGNLLEILRGLTLRPAPGEFARFRKHVRILLRRLCARRSVAGFLKLRCRFNRRCHNRKDLRSCHVETTLKRF